MTGRMNINCANADSAKAPRKSDDLHQPPFVSEYILSPYPRRVSHFVSPCLLRPIFPSIDHLLYCFSTSPLEKDRAYNTLTLR